MLGPSPKSTDAWVRAAAEILGLSPGPGRP